jgi:hypothetical protein
MRPSRSSILAFAERLRPDNSVLAGLAAAPVVLSDEDGQRARAPAPIALARIFSRWAVKKLHSA